MHENAVQVIT